MFELEHHQKILKILNALNVEFCRDVSAYFGGGTLLALQYGEYRWSKDIDFICPLGAGYRKLRSDIADYGYAALFKDQSGIGLPREFKADQYGVRFAVVVDDTLIKFEMVAEGRIALDAPVYPEWCSLPCLSFADSCSEKLLSNADRWADAGIKSRDLIDLAMLRLQAEIPVSATDKAENAYPVIMPLLKALARFQSSPDYRRQCFAALQVKNPAQLMDGIDLLAADHELPPSTRTLSESIA